MNQHTLFYYPYASLTDAQGPLLKAAALYFDRLYILDPEKATGASIGIGEVEDDVNLLEKEGILERVSPEDILVKYEDAITAAIRADQNDREFIRLCETSGRAAAWTLALAKVPKEIRNDPKHKEYSTRNPKDQAMQRFMGELPRSLTKDNLGYSETYAEVTKRYKEQSVYDEIWDSHGKEIEYRYADYPLPLGESIMMNHALFAGLLHTEATPITDDPFHNKVLNYKINRALQTGEVQDVLEDRARQRNLKRDLLVTTMLTDIDLGFIPPAMSVEGILKYRNKHEAELQQARDRLGWLAREIRESPWSKEYADEIDHVTIPKIHKELEPVRKSWASWLKTAGFVAGGVAAVISLTTTPLVPVAVVIGMMGMTKDVVIPGIEHFLDWKQGKKEATGNGLHYFIKLKG